jgi:protein phosphatase
MNSYWQRLLNKILSRQPSIAKIYQLDIGELSDTGKQRDNNQDYIGHIASEDNSAVLAIVADGMGGHKGGEVASRMAVELILQHYDSGEQNTATAKALKSHFEAANTAIYNHAQDTPALQGMGTTLVGLLINQGMACYAYVGDSRLYLIRANKCWQLSTDHTVVAEMVKNGLLTADAAANHPYKNVITRAIGTYPGVEVDSSDKPLPVAIGDCFLLCSDGLHDLVSTAEMMQALVDHNAQQACQFLIQLANSRGGHDNISAIVINVMKKVSSDKILTITRN